MTAPAELALSDRVQVIIIAGLRREYRGDLPAIALGEQSTRRQIR